MTTPYYVEHRVVPWTPAEGDHPLPLGRNVRHDSRNRAYAHQRQDRELTSQLWTRHIPILDQGQIGSCTGNAAIGSIGTDKLFGSLPPSPPLLDENLAVSVYSDAEVIDGDGPYPPNDNGSSGPSVAQVLKNRGLISGYTHAFDLASLLDALEDGPALIGVNWYSSFDSPSGSQALVSIAAGSYVRGGHEVLVRGKDITQQVLFADNSWGTGWGAAGSFSIGYDTMTRLLSEQGDVTIPLPLSQPAPTPVPVPPQPAPDPGPDEADATLFRSTFAWAERRHVGETKAIAKDLTQWYASKGFR